MAKSEKYQDLKNEIAERVDPAPTLLRALAACLAAVTKFLLTQGGGALTISITPDTSKAAFHCHWRIRPDGDTHLHFTETMSPKQKGKAN